MEILGVAFGTQGELQLEWADDQAGLFYRHAVIVPPPDPDEEADTQELVDAVRLAAERLLTHVRRGVEGAEEERPYDNPEDVERRG